MDRLLRTRSWVYTLLAGVAIALALALAFWVLAGCTKSGPPRSARLRQEELMRFSKVRLAIPAAAMAVGLATSAGAAYAATPKAKATPSKHLTNGQSVTVTWRGFGNRRDKYIAMVQCTKASNDGNPAHCDTAHTVVVPAVRKGSVSYVVHTGTIGTLGETCGTTRRDADDCLIGVVAADADFAVVTGQATHATITFSS